MRKIKSVVLKVNPQVIVNHPTIANDALGFLAATQPMYHVIQPFLSYTVH